MPSKKIDQPPWASSKAIQEAHGVAGRVGVEIVFRLTLDHPGDWMDVDELVDKANDFGFAEITKVVPL